MKTAFILSGGGAKGAFQVGVLQRLLDAGIAPDELYGTSVGSLNAVGLSSSDINGLLDIWRNIKGLSSVVRFNLWRALTTGGLFTQAPLRALVAEHLNGKTLHIPTTVTVTNMKRGAPDYYRLTQVTSMALDCIMASCAIPGIMEPVFIANMGADTPNVDGGVSEETPLSVAIQEGATKVYVILANPIGPTLPPWKAPHGPFKIPFYVYHAMQLVWRSTYYLDIRSVIDANGRNPNNSVELHVFAPKSVMNEPLDFSPANIQRSISEGYDAEELLLTLDTEHDV